MASSFFWSLDKSHLLLGAVGVFLMVHFWPWDLQCAHSQGNS